MKKKVLYGVAVALFASVAMGSLQSCKDDVSDLKQQVVFDRNELTGKLNALQQELAACKQNCETEIAALKTRISQNEGDIRQLNVDLQALQQEVAKKASVDQLNTAINNLRTELQGYTDAQIATAVQSINTQIQALDTRLGTAEGKISTLETNVGTLTSDVADLTTRVGEIEGKLQQQEAINAAVQQTLEDLIQANDANSKEISKLVDKYVELQKELDGIRDEFDNVYSEIAEVRDEVGQVYNALMNEINIINDKLERVESAVNALAGWQQNLITGIIVQGAENPVFGNFSLPLGIQSNLLFSWYGDLRDLKFPSANAADQADGVAVTLPAGAVTEDITADGAKFNLGKLFMTINPVGSNFDDTKFTLETSAGNKFVKDLVIGESDYELYFGYTRNEENGFYEAAVELTAEEADQVALKIDDDLKATMKDFVKDPSKRGAVTLLRGVYDQLNGKLPAYAVRYDWSAEAVETPFVLDNEEVVYKEKDYAVFSKYEVAAATAKALSYKFLDGYGSSKRLPEFGAIDNLIAKLKDSESLKFNFGASFEVAGFTVNLGSVEFKNIDNKLKIEIPAIKITDADGNDQNLQTEPITLDPENGMASMADVVNEIQRAINEALTSSQTNLQGSIDTMIANINTQVNDMMKQLNEQINGKVTSLIDQAANKLDPLFKRVNQIINIYNKVAGKINNFLADPNAYLQVAAFYEYNGGVGVVSGKQNDPTTFNLEGGNEITVYLSSYTGEIIVPAYKKYIGCVTDPSVINEVLEGSEYKVAIDASKLTADKTYEFVYQGLDYSGYISTKKFYITVK